jgi:methyl-accepting chemotaxis protein
MSVILAAMCFLQPFKEGSEIYTIAAYEAMMLIIAGLVAHRGFQMIAIFAVGLVGVGLDYWLRILPGGQGDANWINVIICAGILATSAFVGREIMRRSDFLLSMAEAEAAKNKEQVKALESVIRSSEDALGMGAAVKESSDRTGERIARLKELLSGVSAALGALGETVESISGSNKEVADSADAVRERIEDQSAIITQSSSSIEEMTASIESIERITSARREALASLKEATQEGASEMERASESVKAMAGSMASIGELVKVIRKVASQTNLLAMNAAIEAAHAGAAGTGFSVVAGEIRKLSEETERQVKLIGASIKDTLAAVTTATDITEGAHKTFQRIYEGMDSVSKAMAEIGDGLGEIASGSTEILTGVTESVSITSGVKEAALTVDTKIAAASIKLGELGKAGGSVLSGLSEISRLLDELVGEARVMAESGKASEAGLEKLGATLASMKAGK